MPAMNMRELIFACGSCLCVEVAACVMCAETVAMKSFRSIVVVWCSTFHRVILFWVVRLREGRRHTVLHRV